MATKSAALKKDTGTATTTAPAKKPGTAVAVKKTGGALVDANAIREQLRAQAAAMGERTAPASGNKIMVGNDKMFKLPDGSKVPELRAVIVDFVTTHSFYERPYDAKNILPPGCFAVGSNPKDMAPTADSPNLQAENCQVCPMNEFGSAGDGKACKNGRRLAVLPTNEAGDDIDHEGDMLVLDVSPTALRGFDGYVQSLARTYQLPPVGFITTITCDPNSEYAKLMFSDPQPINSLAEAVARQAEAKDLISQKPDFSGWVPVSQTPGNRRGGAVKQPAAKTGGVRR